MDWKSHLVFGLIAGGVVAYLLLGGVEGIFFFAAASGFSALLPDLDMRKSKASRLLATAIFLTIAAGAFILSGAKGEGVQGFIIYSLFLLLAWSILDRLVRPSHRGIMHSLFFLFAATVALNFIAGEFFAAAFAVGYFSHLLLDFQVKLK